MSIENRVTLIGYAGKNAEVGSIKDGKQVARISVAASKRFKDATMNDRKRSRGIAALRMDPRLSTPARFRKALT
jgi:hypothetical protein